MRFQVKAAPSLRHIREAAVDDKRPSLSIRIKEGDKKSEDREAVFINAQKSGTGEEYAVRGYFVNGSGNRQFSMILKVPDENEDAILSGEGWIAK